MVFKKFNSVQRVLHDVAQSYGWETRLWEYRLQNQWGHIVGQPLANHTRPEKIQFRKLHLIVENSLWHQQLIFLKPSLINTINTAIGKPMIADMVFRIGICDTDFTGGNTFERIPTRILPSPSMIQEASRHTDLIKNQELRHILTQVMAKALTDQGRARREDCGMPADQRISSNNT